ncbi:unnamed protein product [Penicillium nalgiovense]|nr:unnamed protein product [Penicillium nalgiovense]CAG8919810.1 unnamed protein product [Penicillium nalgiovense]
MYKVIPEVAARQIIDDYAETCCQVSELTPYNIDSLPTYDHLHILRLSSETLLPRVGRIFTGDHQS